MEVAMNRAAWLSATFERMARLFDPSAPPSDDAVPTIYRSDDPLHQPVMYFVPGLNDRAWHDADAFPFVRAFIERGPGIVAEVNARLEATSMRKYNAGGGAELVDTGDWEMLELASPVTRGAI